jgi:hypothetical protein
METTEHTYEFGYSRNSYFMGHDGTVTRDDGKSITINTRNGRMAINVKDHDGSYSLKDLDEDVQAMAADLRKHGGPEDEYGRDHVDRLYEQERDLWWEMDADSIARDHDFQGVYCEGRSGGWCVIEGTQELADNFPTHKASEQCEVCGEGDHRHDDESDHEFEPDNMVLLRDRFLTMAFDIVDSVAHRRQVWGETIRVEHQELERRREACLIRGND